MHIRYILTSVNTVIKRKNNLRKTPSLNKIIEKINKHAVIYNKHAQNYTKYAQNIAFTNDTP